MIGKSPNRTTPELFRPMLTDFIDRGNELALLADIPFHFFRSVFDISVFLSASCSHSCLVVARYAFASKVTNLLATNTNMTQILTTDLG